MAANFSSVNDPSFRSTVVGTRACSHRAASRCRRIVSTRLARMPISRPIMTAAPRDPRAVATGVEVLVSTAWDKTAIVAAYVRSWPPKPRCEPWSAAHGDADVACFLVGDEECPIGPHGRASIHS
jgi:hypothetical protein